VRYAKHIGLNFSNLCGDASIIQADEQPNGCIDKMMQEVSDTKAKAPAQSTSSSKPGIMRMLKNLGALRNHRCNFRNV
jgi:hypothetical protein